MLGEIPASSISARVACNSHLIPRAAKARMLTFPGIPEEQEEHEAEEEEEEEEGSS